MKILAAAFGLIVILTGVLTAQTARLYHYQGNLTTPDNQNYHGSVDLEFSIFKSPRSEKPIWSETHQQVQVENGQYGVLLGSKNPLKLSFYEFYLEARLIGFDAAEPNRVMIVGSGYNYRLWFLFSAYTIVWLAIFIYVLSIARRQKKLSAELAMIIQENK